MNIYFLVILTFLFTVTNVCQACWSVIPLKGLVSDSDLIVVGTLKDLTFKEKKEGSFAMKEYEGTIHIEEVLAGSPLADKKCILSWTYFPALTPTISHQDLEGEKGVWFLQKNGDKFTAEHPGRFVEMDCLEQVKAFIKTPLYSMSMDNPEDEKHTVVTFIIKTFQEKLEVKDYMKVDKGKLLLYGDIKINITGPDGEVSFKDKVIKKGEGHITVTKDKPYKVQIELGDYFNFKKDGAYGLWWGRSEEDSSERYTFYKM